MRMVSPVIGALAILAWGNASVSSAQPALEGPKPNFLFILADDMGFSDPGCYGGEIATPSLDSLARGGLRFTQFYNTARCWPSRAALMTGYYAQAVRRDSVPGIPSGGRGIRPSWAPLFTEFLRPHGYRNYHSGKWHIDGQPLRNGFDHSYEIRQGDNNFFKADGTTEDGKQVERSAGYYSTTAFGEHAVKCLREHAEKFSSRPFFHYLAFTSPHFPLHAPAQDIAKYQNVYDKGWNATAAARHQRMTSMGIINSGLPEMERHVGPPYHFPEALAKLGEVEVIRPYPWSDLTEAERKFQAAKMAVHAAMVDCMDQAIGQVVAQLKKMGAFENTVIMFASDNGASAEIMVRGDGHDRSAPIGSASTFVCLGPGWSSAANTPFRRHKTWVHEGGISTPLIVHWPAGIKSKGELRRTPAHLIDIMPTILELAGVRRPEEIGGVAVPPAPGKSLVPVFEKDQPSCHEFIWWEHEKNQALRAGDWKLVKDAKGDWELYNLGNDRGEQRNMASSNSAKVRELSAIWQREAERNRALAATDLPDQPAEKRTARKKKAD